MTNSFFARFISFTFFSLLFFGNSEAQDCNTYPDCLDKGLNALKNRDASKAKDYFKDAKKYARKGDGNKDEAKSLREVADDYGDNYFKLLNQSTNYQQSRNFKNLVMLYQASIEKFNRINRRDVADLLKPVDEQLRKTHDSELQKFEQIRKNEIEKAFQSAKKLIVISPTEAVTQLEWIRTQAYPNEAQQMQLETMLSDSYYQKDLQSGKNQMTNGDPEKALTFYKSAQNRKNTPEATALIKETRQKVFEQYIQSGTEQAQKKQYDKAFKSFTKSKEFTDNPSEADSKISYWYDNLYSEGQKAFTAEKYQEALNIYKNAAIFNNSPQLQTAQKEANHGLQLKSARDFLVQGDVPSALQAADRALGFVQSQEASDLKNRLINYNNLINAATQQFSNGKMQEAMNALAQAKAIAPKAQDAYNLDQKIQSYNRSIEQAQQLKKSDPQRALPFARAAQNESNNQQVQQLIAEITRNMHTVVTFTLQGYSNCTPERAMLRIRGTNYDNQVKYQQGGITVTLETQGQYTATLEGLNCPQPQAKQPSDSRIGVSTSALTSTPSAKFSCTGGNIRAILQ